MKSPKTRDEIAHAYSLLSVGLSGVCMAWGGHMALKILWPQIICKRNIHATRKDEAAKTRLGRSGFLLAPSGTDYEGL